MEEDKKYYAFEKKILTKHNHKRDKDTSYVLDSNNCEMQYLNEK